MFNRPTCKVQIDICGTKSELTLLELFGVFKGISFFGGAGGGGRELMKIFKNQLKVGLHTLSGIAYKNETM